MWKEGTSYANCVPEYHPQSCLYESTALLQERPHTLSTHARSSTRTFLLFRNEAKLWVLMRKRKNRIFGKLQWGKKGEKLWENWGERESRRGTPRRLIMKSLHQGRTETSWWWGVNFLGDSTLFNASMTGALFSQFIPLKRSWQFRFYGFCTLAVYSATWFRTEYIMLSYRSPCATTLSVIELFHQQCSSCG